MATRKEMALIREIMALAIKITQGKSGIAISAEYIGHCNAFQVRHLNKDDLTVVAGTEVDGTDWAHLCGSGPWTESDALASLTRQRDNLLTYLESSK